MQFDGDRIAHMTKIWNAGLALRELGWAWQDYQRAFQFEVHSGERSLEHPRERQRLVN
jgi:hypothetical protein